jgi:hypothetical protein
MTDTTAQKALTHAPKPPRSGQSLIERVARDSGVSPFRQFADIFRLRGGRTKLTISEYYEYQLYRPNLPMAQKREFVGERGSLALNLRVAPPGQTHMRNFLADKVAFNSMLVAMGLPTTRIQAAFAPTRGFGALPTLRNADDIRAFLTGPARYPLFGKPVRGAQAMGSVMILGVDAAAGTALLGNGQTVQLAALAAEAAANTTFGYVFQDAIANHPDIVALTGSCSVSTVRVVTVNRTDLPEVLYTSWKLPSNTAMSDNFWQKGSLIASVAPQTGVVQKIRYGTGPDTQWPETHPVSGTRLKDVTLPLWQATLDLAIAAHATVPDNGILGWDIAVTPDGPVMIECNENTGHALYQLAADRGVLNADFLPVFDQVMARNARLLADFESGRKAYQKAKAQF